MSISEAIRNWVLSPAILKLTEMEKLLMAQLDDLNAAIQAEDVQIQQIGTVVTKVDSDLDALAAAIKAGSTPADLTTQIQAIQAHTAAISTAIAQLTATDTKDAPTAA